LVWLHRVKEGRERISPEMLFHSCPESRKKLKIKGCGRTKVDRQEKRNE